MRNMERRDLLLGSLALGLGVAVGCSRDDGSTSEPKTPTAKPPEPSPTAEKLKDPTVEGALVDRLAVPWAIVVLADGSALVTQRDRGEVVRVDESGKRKTVGRVSQLRPGGEGGLQGLAIDPNDDSVAFTFVTTRADNRVLRWEFDGDRLRDPKPILTGLTAAGIHHGGALLPDGDGNIFVSVGDASSPQLAQDMGSLHGKILRITPSGKAAKGNPRNDRLWSWGHRNIEGLAFDERDRLWSTEFGQDAWDELNLIEPGENYGWPEVEGDGGEPSFRDPHVKWKPKNASPAGIAIFGGFAWIAGLRGSRLWRVPLPGLREGKPKEFFVGEFGRLRSVAAAPGGKLWVGTSNRDGRGDPKKKDDRILIIDPGVPTDDS